MTAYVHFTRPVPVGASSIREEHFSEADGWRIEVRGSEVVLSREAEGIRPAVPAFRVVGVGFCAKDVPPTLHQASAGSTEVGDASRLIAEPLLENFSSPPTEEPKSGGAKPQVTKTRRRPEKL